MAWTVEQDTGDLVFNGWEKGIAPSPHVGVGNLQGVDINTEQGEVMLSYARSSQLQAQVSGGTVTQTSSSTVSMSPFPTVGTWITIGGSTISGLSNGNYYVASVTQLATAFTQSSSGIVSGMGSGTATWSTIPAFDMGAPVQSQIETYTDVNGATQYRYYVADINGRVFVHDSFTLTTLTTPNWFLPYTGSISTYSGTAETQCLGLGFIAGWLFIFGGSSVYTVNSSQLGTAPALSIAAHPLMAPPTPGTSNPHFAYTGHQDIMYYTDTNLIGSMDPDTSLVTGLGINIQSYCQYTASSFIGTISDIIAGTLPTPSTVTSTTRVPAWFFAGFGATHPTALDPAVAYYIDYTPGLSTYGNFNVYYNLTGTLEVTCTGAIGSAATSATIASYVDSAGATHTTWDNVTANVSVVFSNGDMRTVTFTHGSTAITWGGGLTGGGGTAIIELGTINIATGASGNQFFNTFNPVSNNGQSCYTFTPQRVILPSVEVATCITENDNTVLIGTKSNILYSWNQLDAFANDLLPMPENNTAWLITVNNSVYAGVGNRGNIYITNGSSVSLAITVPDYCTGLIEPYFVWGGAMFLRGRVWFSIQDQTTSHTGNCGGVWSFVPTQNFSITQDVGVALRMDNKASYDTYNGRSILLIPNQNQAAQGPQYWNVWNSNINSPTYGIDGSSLNSVAATIDTDIVPTGTFLEKKTFSQIEYKLAAQLYSTETVTISFRTSLSDSFVSAGTVQTESSTGLSGIIPVSFEKTQWLQLQISLNGDGNAGNNNTFVRLTEVRVR